MKSNNIWIFGIFVLLLSINCYIVSAGYYETYDSVTGANFTGGNVGATYKYNTTNGYESQKNSYTQAYAYPLYVSVNEKNSLYIFTQMAHIIDATSNQYYGQQGIQFYNTTSGLNYTLFVTPNMTQVFPKTMWKVYNGTSANGYASTILTVSGCIGIPNNTWVREKLVIEKISTTQYNISMFIINVSENNICNGSALWSDSNMQTLDSVRWGAKDGHSVGSPGYRFDEVSISIGNYNLSDITCTSCNPPVGDITPPYETDDTTPTFVFDSGISISCRIGDQNINYTAMSSSRDCDYGQSMVSHTCTLTAQDGIVDYNTTIYVSCNYIEANNATFSLPMLISSLETPNSTEAIQQGIENSIIGSGATVYTNQKVYLRMLNGSTVNATATKVAAYGNQRWIFSYVNATGTKPGLFNLSPVVYSLDMKNMTIKAIRANVTAFINSTKS
ncbi:MAG: hypothetical protein ACP5OA_01760 [Candidatus Woesearchaeota archaeon]